jgi:hypothetical protein
MALTPVRFNAHQGRRIGLRPVSVQPARKLIMKMKTIKIIGVITLIGAAIAVPVLAQPGPGASWGPGMGGGMGMQNGGPGAGRMGPGGPGMAGVNLITSEERTAFQVKMRAVKTYDECKLVQDEQHKTLQARAKEKGITLPTPRQNGCDMMKARGLIG